MCRNANQQQKCINIWLLKHLPRPPILSTPILPHSFTFVHAQLHQLPIIYISTKNQKRHTHTCNWTSPPLVHHETFNNISPFAPKWMWTESFTSDATLHWFHSLLLCPNWRKFFATFLCNDERYISLLGSFSTAKNLSCSTHSFKLTCYWHISSFHPTVHKNDGCLKYTG